MVMYNDLVRQGLDLGKVYASFCVSALSNCIFDHAFGSGASSGTFQPSAIVEGYIF